MTEPTWDIEALTRFPDLIEEFEGVTTMYQLWSELTDAFKRAYGEPKNADLIERIYQFAFWCCKQPCGNTASDDLGTCVCVCFFEEIPTIDAAIPDMPKWFSHADVLMMKSTFSYMVGEEGYQKVLQAYEKPRQPHGRKKS